MSEYKHIQRWTLPRNYGGAHWPEYYRAGFGQSRDSDALERSNFEVALRELGGETDTVIVVREGHWAVGWVEWIAIHESDTAALAIADELNASQEAYPVLDDDHFSNLEYEEAGNFWDGLSAREKVQEAMHERKRYHWLENEPVWHLGRLDYHDLCNYGSTISEALCERIRCG